MNKAKLKNYAPAARRDFIRAVTDRAHLLGLAEGSIEPIEVKGDIALIGGRPYPKKVAAQRKGLEARIQRDGFGPVMEAVAYTWFNRFAALRYMELHDYLEHGYRVLSHPNGGVIPELLEQAANIEFPGLDRDKVVTLKLDGNKDADLYRLLLVAQCNALATAMPFMFERIDDETELLLPDNLLHSDSLVRKLVTEIEEADWQQVEIIGWLYQFYISEKKDQVIGKVVKSEDIPAATQLFTPNWIVQYLVQNSVGRLWLMANPTSTLKSQWPYYIQPAEQIPEVQAQLDALIQFRMDADGGSLNPETITVLDPACGSGHILVVAYDVLKAIYLERGYQPRAIPRLILEKNLYGLDIDDRAAQMAGFALLMKARADDRRLLDNPPKLNALALQESKGLDAEDIIRSLSTVRAELVDARSIRLLLDTFAHAKTFGSLIQIPKELDIALPKIGEGLKSAMESGDVFAQAAAQDLLPLVRQALLLAMKFDAVVANPPYMGSKGMNAALKEYAKVTFPDGKSDLFAMFIERGFDWCKAMGFNSMVTMQSWMFLSSYEAMRQKLLQERTIQTMAHLGARAFSEISGEVVQTTAFVFQGKHFSSYKPAFFRLVEGQEEQKETALRLGQNRFDTTVQDDFKKISGSPVAYWATDKLREIFRTVPNLGIVADTKQGLATTNNSLFLRQWHEIDISKAGFGLQSTDEALASGKKWFPLNKGGSLRRWYGNNELLINFEKNGQTICDYIDNTPGVNVKSNGRVINRDRYFKEGLTWSSLASGGFSMRHSPNGFIFETKGAMCFPKKTSYLPEILALFNSKLIDHFLLCLSPTLDYHEGPLKLVPTKLDGRAEVTSNVREAIEIGKNDWDSFELSWEFESLFFSSRHDGAADLRGSWGKWSKHNARQRARMQSIEEQNNRLFIEAYGLQDELSPEVPEDQITLARADREKDCQRLISYAIGCMMGRYSLNESGLIYANAGNVGFDPTRYKTFAADADGIVPITDESWFDDDAANRVREFLLTVWGAETLDENMAWLAESLGTRGNETPEETIRRYVSASFYKDHLQTYKKRPIYWLFSSGKQGAFQCLVYLHRYNEATLSRMRAEYVTPLQGKLSARATNLQDEVNAAPSTAARNKLQKQLDTTKKKQAELAAFDDLLRHYADQRISLDLDDGVKVNYGKFGNLLAEVKAVTGGAGDD
jgi:type II restriction/modification system DNA methylase subunit YeeA